MSSCCFGVMEARQRRERAWLQSGVIACGGRVGLGAEGWNSYSITVVGISD